jgi:hypothetical protein
VCRHANALCAVNMVRSGERYAYTHFLLKNNLWRAGVDFLFWDIACKGKPWVQKANAAVVASAHKSQELERLAAEMAGLATAAAHTRATTTTAPCCAAGATRPWPLRLSARSSSAARRPRCSSGTPCWAWPAASALMAAAGAGPRALQAAAAVAPPHRTAAEYEQQQKRRRRTEEAEAALGGHPSSRCRSCSQQPAPPAPERVYFKLLLSSGWGDAANAPCAPPASAAPAAAPSSSQPHLVTQGTVAGRTAYRVLVAWARFVRAYCRALTNERSILGGRLRLVFARVNCSLLCPPLPRLYRPQLQHRPCPRLRRPQRRPAQAALAMVALKQRFA